MAPVAAPVKSSEFSALVNILDTLRRDVIFFVGGSSQLTMAALAMQIRLCIAELRECSQEEALEAASEAGLQTAQCVPLLQRSALKDPDDAPGLAAAAAALINYLSGQGSHTFSFSPTRSINLRLVYTPQATGTHGRIWRAEHVIVDACEKQFGGVRVGGSTVVEVGCGTAGAGLACAALGATSVWLTDVDEGALAQARENAEINELSDRVTVGVYDVMRDKQAASSSSSAPVEGGFECVLAADIPFDFVEPSKLVSSLIRLLARTPTARILLVQDGDTSRSEAHQKGIHETIEMLAASPELKGLASEQREMEGVVLHVHAYGRSNGQKEEEEVMQIDGALLEGGGQVIRSSLSLAWLVGSRPLRLHSIRAGRPKPGLANQHLVGARLTATLGGRTLTGDYKGSTEMLASPRQTGVSLPASLEAAAETAGATTLMLQAALPPLLFCASGRELSLRGGTEVGHSPPVAHTMLVLAPLLELMGVTLDVRVEGRGFNDGGALGQLLVKASARAPTLKPLDLTSRGAPSSLKGLVAATDAATGRALLEALEKALFAVEALRDLESIALRLEAPAAEENAGGGKGGGGKGGGGKGKGKGGKPRKAEVSVQLALTTDTGCVLSANVGRSLRCGDDEAAQSAIDECCNHLCTELSKVLASGACACEHTSDQLVVYMALAKGTSRLRAPPKEALTSQHLPTVLHFASLLSGCAFRVTTAEDGCQLIECDGIGATVEEAPPVEVSESADAATQSNTDSVMGGMALLDTGNGTWGILGGMLANIIPLKDTEFWDPKVKARFIDTFGKLHKVTAVNLYALTLTGSNGRWLDVLTNLVKPDRWEFAHYHSECPTHSLPCGRRKSRIKLLNRLRRRRAALLKRGRWPGRRAYRPTFLCKR